MTKAQDGNSHSHIREILDSLPWEAIIPRLLLYASNKLKGRWWYGILGGSVPGGKDAGDIVGETITDVLFGADHSGSVETGGEESSVPGGKDAGDIVGETITDVLFGADHSGSVETGG